VVRDDGGLNEKFPGGVEGHAAKLRAEDHHLEKSPRGKKLRIKDFEKSLQKF